ncbi:MAG: MoxR-like ATPase [Gammaproteobacteria bacterium]|jgi:MoxR-like ATPase
MSGHDEADLAGGLVSGAALYQRIVSNVEHVITGQSTTLRTLLAALAGGGHVLLEDYPGTGKTTMAKAVSLSIGAEFKRVQFTPDLLPSDILGVSVFDPREQVFNFREGPIFTNILLADEINRASPRTQSALLEAMAEGQVTIEGHTHQLAQPFLVIATQNPVEFRGTYPLPEAQMDRFAVRLSLGYLELDAEVAMVAAQSQRHPLEALEACASLADIRTLREQVKAVQIAAELRYYAVELVRATRTSPSVQLGAGPRASIALLRMAQALAMFDGMDFVGPEHLHEAAIAVIAHRLVLDAKARFSGITQSTIVQEALAAVPVPA